MQRVMPFLVLEVVIFALLVTGVQSYISFTHVWETATTRAMHYSLGSFGWYLIEALTNTELTAKILLAAGVLLVGLATRDMVRASRHFHRNFMQVSRVM